MDEGYEESAEFEPLTIGCACQICGKEFDYTIDSSLAPMIAATWPLLGVDNWDDYAAWHKQTALCEDCIAKKNKAMERLNGMKANG